MDLPRHTSRPRLRASSIGLLVTLVLAAVLAFAPGAAPAGAAPRAFSSATLLAGINAGNGPQLASGPDGTNLAVFYERDDLQYVAATRPVTETAWEAPIHLAKPAGVVGPLLDVNIADDLTQIVVSSTGAVAPTYTKLAIWRRAPGAATWAAPVEVPFPATATIGIFAQVLSDGSVLMGWFDVATSQIKAARVAPGASTFSATENVSAVNEGAGFKMWAGRNGQAAIAWAKKGTNTFVTSIRPTPTSAFGAPQTIPRDGVTDDSLANYEVALGDDGRAAFVAEVRTGFTGWKVKVWLRPNAGSWDDGEIVSTGTGNSFEFPEVGIDGSGRTTVAWQNTLTNLSNSGKVVQVTEKGPGALDPWLTPATLSEPSTFQEVPSLAVASDGTAGVTWAFGDNLPFAYGEPGSNYFSAYTTRVSWRTNTGSLDATGDGVATGVQQRQPGGDRGQRIRRGRLVPEHPVQHALRSRPGGERPCEHPEHHPHGELHG